MPDDSSSPNPLYGRFDDVVGAVLGVSNPKVKPTVATWAVPLQRIYDNGDKRLDASHYDRETALALEQLAACGCPLKPFSKVATLSLPSQFVRIWAKEKAYGLPYVNATDLMGLMGIGSLSDEPRYLSRETDVDIEDLIIREGWLLISCSGTIGRVFYVPKRMDGWAATHDLIRAVPDKGVPVGFLHAYLSSPIAQKQIIGHTHGGQIDHVTDEQVGEILVPIIGRAKMDDLHNRTMRSLAMREQAIGSLAEIAEEIKRGIRK